MIYKEILFTHDDLDGAGCRVIYELAHSHMHNELNGNGLSTVVNCSNQSVNDDTNEWLNSGKISPDETLITFADIVCSREILQHIKDLGYKVNIFDHHGTNYGAAQIYPNAVITEETPLGVPECGTSLMYQYYSKIAIDDPSDPYGIYFGAGVTPTESDEYTDDGLRGNQKLIEKFVDTVRSYDTWEWKSTNNVLAKQLSILFFLLGMDRFCDRYITLLKNDNHANADKLISDNDMDFVSARIDNEQDAIDNFDMTRVIDANVRGYRGAIIVGYTGAGISEFGNQFMEHHPEYDFMGQFMLGKDGKYQFRSIRDDLDIGKEIAAPIGGGGHPKAAGATMSQETLDQILDLIIDELIM